LNWICATESAGWLNSHSHTSVVFDNKIWVIGGNDGFSDYNDVWLSNDGVNWTCAKESAPWSPRSCHTSVVFENKIWILGGNGLSPSGSFNNVWYSTNGADWICKTDSAQWPSRWGHETVCLNKAIWIFAGAAYYVNKTGSGHTIANDVWFSLNGIDWTCATASAQWSKREYFTSVIFNNEIWILGGYHENDVWYGEIVDGER
jgi:hypothetical protein